MEHQIIQTQRFKRRTFNIKPVSVHCNDKRMKQKKLMNNVAKVWQSAKEL